ncbi:GFA family protein [Rhizobium sullae]|nr:GFA family protein [Rhizobium sullae]
MPSSNQAQEHPHMTTHTSLPLRGSCECSACSFEVHTSPKARFRCHCLICQEFNGKPFADVVAVRARDVVLKNAGNISFKKYRAPPNFNRGVCRTCGKPVVEVAGVGPLKVVFIPASNFEPEARLPPARIDIFYHRRVLDMPDSVPKYSGYFASELAIGKLIMSGL